MSQIYSPIIFRVSTPGLVQLTNGPIDGVETLKILGEFDCRQNKTKNDKEGFICFILSLFCGYMMLN